MALPPNAARDRRKRWTYRGPQRPAWAQRVYWPDEKPLDGPVTLHVERCDDDAYWRGHARWLIYVAWGRGWQCSHDAMDSRSIIRVAQAECIADLRGRPSRTVRVRRTVKAVA